MSTVQTCVQKLKLIGGTLENQINDLHNDQLEYEVSQSGPNSTGLASCVCVDIQTVSNAYSVLIHLC